MGVDISRIAVLLGYAILMGFGLFKGGKSNREKITMRVGWFPVGLLPFRVNYSRVIVVPAWHAWSGLYRGFSVSGRLLEVLWALSFVGFFW